jgi:hypothetical protein
LVLVVGGGGGPAPPLPDGGITIDASMLWFVYVCMCRGVYVRDVRSLIFCVYECVSVMI